MTKREQRLRDVIALLRETNGASIKELASTFSVSEMTVRRDLDTLQERSLVTLVAGGAAIYNGSRNDAKDMKYELHGGKR